MANIINRVINKFYIVEDGYRAELKGENIWYDNKRNLKFEEMTLKELTYLRENYPSELSEEKFQILKNRLQENLVTVYGVKNGEDILGYFCMSFRNIKENGINYTIQVGEDSVYLFDDYSFERYRGMGAHKFSIIKRMAIAAELGKKYAIVNVYSWNSKSISNYRALGFNEYIRYYYYKVIKKIKVKVL